MRILNFYHPFNFNTWKTFASMGCLILLACTPTLAQAPATGINSITRQRISIDENWRFYKYDSTTKADGLIYDVRPEVKDHKDDRPADAKPTVAEDVQATQMMLRLWILPTGNDFIKNPAKRYVRPEGNEFV